MEQIVYDSFELLLASSRASKSASLPNVECLPVRQFIATSKLSFNKYTVIVFAASAHVMNSKKRESTLLNSAQFSSTRILIPLPTVKFDAQVAVSQKACFSIKTSSAIPHLQREREREREREQRKKSWFQVIPLLASWEQRWQHSLASKRVKSQFCSLLVV